MIAANSWLHTKNPVRLLQFIIYEIVLIQTSLFFSINLNETVNLCDLDYSFGKSSDDNKGMYVVEMLASARIWQEKKRRRIFVDLLVLGHIYHKYNKISIVLAHWRSAGVVEQRSLYAIKHQLPAATTTATKHIMLATTDITAG